MLGTSKSIWGFDPRSIPGCTLWLDGADNASMNSTSAVTVWNDKSGQSNNMTGTGTWSGGTMVFNGTTNAFSNTLYAFPFGAYSMFAVYSNTTAPASNAYMNAVYGSNGFPMLGTFGLSRFVTARSVVANTGALVNPVPVGWAARITSTGAAHDTGIAIATDPSGNVVVTGKYGAALTVYNQGPSGTAGTTLPFTESSSDLFVAKYSTAGAVLWAAQIAGTGSDIGNGITTDTSGNVVVTGYYSTAVTIYNQGPTGSGVVTLPFAGGLDCFIAKYSSAGAVLWAARIASASIDIGQAVATDTSGSVFVTGYYSTAVTIYNQDGTTATTLPFIGGNCFIAKYSSAGAVLWAARIAGTATSGGAASAAAGTGIATDPSGNVLVTGNYSAAVTLYNTGGGIGATLPFAGGSDVFVAKYSTAGAVLWAARIAGAAGNGIATDSSGNVVVTGYYNAEVTIYNQGPTGSGVVTLPFAGGFDCFIAKYSSAGAVLWAARIASAGNDVGWRIATDSSGNVLVTGKYTSAGTIIYNQDGTTATTLPFTGGQDCFIAKYSSAGAVLWAARIAGTTTGNDVGNGIATDSSGNVFVTGSYSTALTIYNRDETTATTLPLTGGQDCFIAKYSPDGFVANAPTTFASSNVLVSATYTPSTFSPFVNGFTPNTLAGTTLTTTGLFLGGPSNYFNGSISEVLVFGTTLTAAQRQSVEGYLSRKWGIGTGLISTHPFYTIPPFNRYFNPTDVPGCSLWLDGIDGNSLTTAPAYAADSGFVTTLAGSSGGFADGTGTAASFSSPIAAAVIPSNDVTVVADYNNHRIRLVTPLGVVTTLAGSGTATFADGTGAAASFAAPWGVAVIPSSDVVFVADSGNNRIRVVTYPGGVVTTLAGGGSSGAFADGTGAAARFFSPRGVAFIPSLSSLVVADSGNNRIRLVTYPGGVVTTLAGSGTAAFADGTGAGASFNNPLGVAVIPSSGVIVVSDSGNHRIRLVTQAGVVTTLAGNATGAFVDGTGTAASFWNPRGVAVTSTGQIVVADYENHRIRVVTTSTYAADSGVVTTLAGSTSGFANGTGTAGRFFAPGGVAVASTGQVVVADMINHRIGLITSSATWSDKSGLNNNVTGLATWTGSNVSFNGSTNAFSNTSYVFPISNYSMFAVYSNTTAPATVAYMNALYGSNGFPMLGTYVTTTNGTWTPLTPPGIADWQTTAIGSTGSNIVAGIYSGYIWTGTYNGSTWAWTQQTAAGVRTWVSCASDSNGSNICAGARYTGLWTGRFDGSTWTWTEQTGAGTPGTSQWYSAASDLTGSNICAAEQPGYIWTGRFNGTTWAWTQQTAAGSNGWQSVASDSTGSNICGGMGNGNIRTGMFNGTTWAWTSSRYGGRNWFGLASDSTGSNIVGVVNSAGIYTGKFNGSTWTWAFFATGTEFTFFKIASDSTGSNLAAASSAGYVYTGKYDGAAWRWTLQTNSGLNSWKGIASDSTGSRLVAAYYGALVTGDVSFTSLPTARSVVANTGPLSLQVGWATRITGTTTSTDVGLGIAADSSGNVLVAGYYSAAVTLFNTGGGTGATLPITGSQSVFVAKYTSAGTVVWAAQIGATSGVTIAGIITDSSGNAFATGTYYSAVTLFNTGGGTGATLSLTGGADAFVAKYSPTGTVLWATRITGTGAVNDNGLGIATDSSGNVLVTGYYSAAVTLFNTGGGTGATLPFAGGIDVFVAKYSTAGAVLWAAQIAGTGSDIGNGIATDSSGNVLVTGYYSAALTLYNTGGGTGATLPFTGGLDCFIAKYSSAGAVLWAAQITGSGTSSEQGKAIATDPSGNVFITGQYPATLTLYNTDGTTGTTLPFTGGQDVFVAKYSTDGAVLWAARITGTTTSVDIGQGIATDSSGNAFVTGYCSAVTTLYNTDGTTGATLAAPGQNQCFIAKYSSAGAVTWAARAGGTNGIGQGIATDSSGNVLVIGYYVGGMTLYNSTGESNAALTFTGGADVFVAKYSPDGFITVSLPASSNVLVSATYTPSTFSPFINGSNAITLAGTTLATTGIFVGGPSNYFNGTISELLIYFANLTSNQRQQVEGYLIKKWGLSAQTLSNHQYKLIPPAASQPAQFAEVTQGNWTRDWQPDLQSLIARNNPTNATVIPTVSYGTGGPALTPALSTESYMGGVLAPNGNIYCPGNFSTSNILIINPTTNAVSYGTGGPALTPALSTRNYFGGVLAPNGNIYCVPSGAAYILIINPTTNAVSYGTNSLSPTQIYRGGVLAPNGDIYCVPSGASNILIINPTTNAVSYGTSSLSPALSTQTYYGGVLAPNGSIYCMPVGASNILIINPTTNAVSYGTGGPALTPALSTQNYIGGVLAPNGNIYCVPFTSSNILIINPTTNAVSYGTGGPALTPALSTQIYRGGVLAPNGNIYYVPATASNILIVNPTTNAVSYGTGGPALTPALSTETYGGGVLAPNGNIYCVPITGSNILIISNTYTQLPSSNYVLSAYANKF